MLWVDRNHLFFLLFMYFGFGILICSCSELSVKSQIMRRMVQLLWSGIDHDLARFLPTQDSIT